jgi:hypothetical protein
VCRISGAIQVTFKILMYSVPRRGVVEPSLRGKIASKRTDFRFEASMPSRWTFERSPAYIAAEALRLRRVGEGGPVEDVPKESALAGGPETLPARDGAAKISGYGIEGVRASWWPLPRRASRALSA